MIHRRAFGRAEIASTAATMIAGSSVMAAIADHGWLQTRPFGHGGRGVSSLMAFPLLPLLPPLSSVTTQHVQGLLKRKLEQGLSPLMVQYILSSGLTERRGSRFAVARYRPYQKAANCANESSVYRWGIQVEGNKKRTGASFYFFTIHCTAYSDSA